MSISVKSNEIIFTQEHVNATQKLKLYVTYQKEHNDDNEIFITTTNSADDSQHDFSMSLPEIKTLLSFAIAKLEEVE